MDMDKRKIKILRAIINDYIITAEPVGSRTIAKKYDLGISSATIRNEMADLEEMGYLKHTHTSSGRTPSDKGYRLYVDKLMLLNTLTPQEESIIKNKILDNAMFEMDSIIRGASVLLSELTKLTCIVKPPSVNKSSLRTIQLVDMDGINVLSVIITDTGLIRNSIIRSTKQINSDVLAKISNILNSRLRKLTIEDINLEVINTLKNDLTGYEDMFSAIIISIYESLNEADASKVYLEGATNMFNYPEFNDIEKVKQFLDLINNKNKIDVLFNSTANINIKIGAENIIEGAEHCSVISATYSIGEKPVGFIGVIGPTRIPYAKVITILNTIVKELNEYLTLGYLDDK